MAIHFTTQTRPMCNLFSKAPTTRNPDEVTCKRCRKICGLSEKKPEPKTLKWMYRKAEFVSKIEVGVACQVCGKMDSIIELPEVLKMVQPDKTTHVCHPLLGGCSHGFSKE